MLVDLVSDNWHEMPLGNFEDVEDVLFAENAATWVGRICENDGGSLIIYEGLQVEQVNFPVFFGDEPIRSRLDSKTFSEGSIN